ncbi:hypothetical protein PO909_031968 [Leuciscus waleckii]
MKIYLHICEALHRPSHGVYLNCPQIDVAAFISPQGQTTSISCHFCPLSRYCDLSHSDPYEWTILAFTRAFGTAMTAAGAACPAPRALRQMKGILGGHTDVAAH